MDLQRGLIRAYDPASHTAAVLLTGSLSRILLNVPVANNIRPDLCAEGTACAVAFFQDRSAPIVLSTLDGPPAPPYTIYQDTGSDLTLTTDWVPVTGITTTVTPPSPETWTALVMVQSVLRHTGAAELATLYARIAQDGVMVGTYGQCTSGDASMAAGVALFYAAEVSYAAPRTYTILARKSGGTTQKQAIQNRLTILALHNT